MKKQFALFFCATFLFSSLAQADGKLNPPLPGDVAPAQLPQPVRNPPLIPGVPPPPPGPFPGTLASLEILCGTYQLCKEQKEQCLSAAMTGYENCLVGARATRNLGDFFYCEEVFHDAEAVCEANFKSCLSGIAPEYSDSPNIPTLRQVMASCSALRLCDNSFDDCVLKVEEGYIRCQVNRAPNCPEEAAAGIEICRAKRDECRQKEVDDPLGAPAS